MKKDTIKNSEIRVPHGVMKRLKDDFGCSYRFYVRCSKVCRAETNVQV